MIIYNITTNVSWAVHDNWLPWLQQQYIPQVLQTGCFIHSQILRLLDTDDEEGPTYAIQFQASSQEDYQTFRDQHHHSFEQQVLEKWGDHIISFESLMAVLH